MDLAYELDVLRAVNGVTGVNDFGVGSRLGYAENMRGHLDMYQFLIIVYLCLFINQSIIFSGALRAPLKTCTNVDWVTMTVAGASKTTG